MMATLGRRNMSDRRNQLCAAAGNKKNYLRMWIVIFMCRPLVFLWISPW